MFATVFPRPISAAPTPEVTPEIGSISSPGQAFGLLTRSTGAVEDAVQISRAWSIAIHWFSSLLDSHVSHLDRQHQHAFELLIKRQHEAVLLESWYISSVTARFEAVREHYSMLTHPWHNEHAGLTSIFQSSVQSIAKKLDKCLAIATVTVRNETSDVLQHWFQRLSSKTAKKWTAMVLSLPFGSKLEDAMAMAMCTSLAMSSPGDGDAQCWLSGVCRCTIDLDSIPLKQLRYIGLGGSLAETALARAVQMYLNGSAVHKQCFRVDWQNRTSCVDRLQSWVYMILAPVVKTALDSLSDNANVFDEQRLNEINNAAVVGLGRSRIANLFDYVKAWPHSQGAIEDIRAFLGDDDLAHKLYLCNECGQQIQRRLLHTGASTSEILAIYVNLIHVFELLDARGVLLEKVSPVLRQYLRTRNDAANIIACSLLADPDADRGDKVDHTMCVSIAVELQDAAQDQAQPTSSLEWDDLNWMPEPIDAGPNHRNARSKDVLSHILSLYDQDDFIKEVEAVLAEQLLKSTDAEIVRETKLLEVLKSRLDVVKLQSLEVMLKDMRDSITFEKRLIADKAPTTIPTPKEIQAAIPAHGVGISELYSRFDKRMRRTQFQAVLKLVAVKRDDMLFPKRGRLPFEPEAVKKQEDVNSAFQVRVLSSSAWPQMRSSNFSLPSVVTKHLEHAEERFSALSGQRRLHWRPALGTISVSLELEDRTVSESDLPAWYGAVVHAFGESEQQQLQKPTLAPTDLVQMLQMDEQLVQEALSFWTRKRVLYQQSSGEYAVLERLDMDAMDIQTAVLPAAADTFSALKSQDALLREQAPTFEAFIGNMLRNAGPKEIDGMMGITNMMKMVLPSFTYGDDEVLWLLNQMLSRGEVSRDGDSWKMASD